MTSISWWSGLTFLNLFHRTSRGKIPFIEFFFFLDFFLKKVYILLDMARIKVLLKRREKCYGLALVILIKTVIIGVNPGQL
jgi:hypothetical protein